MRTAVVTIPLIMASVTSAMDPPEILWERTYPNRLLDVRETQSGDYVCAGWELSSGLWKCVFCYDENGEVVWEFHDPEHPKFYVAYAVIQLPGGEIVAVGTGLQEESSSQTSLAITKLSSAGNRIWTRVYEFPDRKTYGSRVTLLPDGGFAVCGYSQEDEEMTQALVLRTDAQGDTLWTREWGWDWQDAAMGVVYHEDTLLVLMRGRLEGDPYSTYFLRYSMSGDLLSEHRMSELPDGFNRLGIDMCEASDGGLLILTEYGPVVIAHTDYFGNVDWMFGPPGGAQPYGQSVSTTMDGGILFGGLSLDIPPEEDISDSYNRDTPHGMVTRHDSLGNELWRDYVYNSGCIAIYSVRQLSQGGYIAAGRTSSQGFLMRYAPELGVEEEGFSSGVAITGLTPNPSCGTVTVGFIMPGQGETVIQVFDLTGRLVDEIAGGVFPAGEHTVTWTPSPALAAGCYLVRVASEGVMDTETCVLLR